MFLAAVTAVTIIALEYAVGTWITSISAFERKFPSGDMRYPYPYIMFKGKPSARDHNIYGFRGDAPNPSKKPNEYRVFVLGGSTVYIGRKPEDTIPGRLQECFDPDDSAGGKDIHVFNWGVVSGNSGMEVARILFEIADHDPDMIIMYNGGNDIYTPYVYDPRPGYPFNFVAYEKNPFYDHSSVSLFYVLVSRSKLLRPLFFNRIASTAVELQRMREMAGHGTEQWRTQIAAQYVMNINRARIVSEGCGAVFRCFYQPMLPFKGTFSQQERAFIPSEEFGDHVRQMRDEVRKHVALRPLVRAVFHDLSDLFTGRKETVYTDFIHVKDKYNKEVADAVFSVVRADLN